MNAPLVVGSALLVLFGTPCALGAGGNTLQGKIVIDTAADDLGPAIVYVTGFTAAKAGKDPEVIQADEKFEPAFVPIVQGQSIHFINRDTKSHNVFSNSEARKFDLGSADPGSQSKILFPNAGLVDVFCNIHPSMEMRILVLQNPAFSLASSGKAYKITGIPDGKFKVFAWHPKGRPKSQEVELKGGQVKSIDWSLDSGIQSAPHLNKYGRPYREKKSY